jgi:hypothetical protein
MGSPKPVIEEIGNTGQHFRSPQKCILTFAFAERKNSIHRIPSRPPSLFPWRHAHAHQLAGIWATAECIAILFDYQLMRMCGPIDGGRLGIRCLLNKSPDFVYF